MFDACQFPGCACATRLYAVSPRGRKIWYCVEHYDRMAAYYKEEAFSEQKDTWHRDMVRANGW